jgi:hypothetical protein
LIIFDTLHCTHDWRIELIQVLPFGLAGRHHVDFGVFEWPTVPHLGHDLLRVGAERAVLADEQGVAQTPLLAEDGGYSHVGDGSGDAD